MSRKLDWDAVDRYHNPKTHVLTKGFRKAAKKDAEQFAARMAAGRHSKKKAGPVKVFTPEEIAEFVAKNGVPGPNKKG